MLLRWEALVVYRSEGIAFNDFNKDQVNAAAASIVAMGLAVTSDGKLSCTQWLAYFAEEGIPLIVPWHGIVKHMDARSGGVTPYIDSNLGQAIVLVARMELEVHKLSNMGTVAPGEETTSFNLDLKSTSQHVASADVHGKCAGVVTEIGQMLEVLEDDHVFEHHAGSFAAFKEELNDLHAFFNLLLRNIGLFFVLNSYFMNLCPRCSRSQGKWSL